ncbi:DNA-binding helix-turn-helix protein [Clostridium sp. KLE 1755]|jgi:transcriptional regulator with XRE-family HTH domain|nr:DNA-binding helix-turn-helix protein [Clostridium sp. KLE 1755]
MEVGKNMDNISKLVGARIRGFRKEKHLSQEELAEKCNLHPTYIGQLERGEKNPTIESVMKISDGLQVPLDQLFANVTAANFPAMDYIPDKIMFLVMELTPKEQKIIYELILLALKLRN